MFVLKPDVLFTIKFAVFWAAWRDEIFPVCNFKHRTECITKTWYGQNATFHASFNNRSCGIENVVNKMGFSGQMLAKNQYHMSKVCYEFSIHAKLLHRHLRAIIPR